MTIHHIPVRFLFGLFLLLHVGATTHAQVCTGDLGDPVLLIDFGKGTAQFGPPIAETTYRYIAGNPEDGSYTIVKSTAGLNTGWHQNVVNRQNESDGYFMLVNADYNKGVFYEKEIQGLCPNTTYEFSAYIINILRSAGIRPNVRFTIDFGGSSRTFITGDIPEGNAHDWKKYGLVFTTPVNVTRVTLRMTNENPGGNGNDLALDDIAFRACGPIITPSIDQAGLNAILCAGETATLRMEASVSAVYNDPVYQWQRNEGGNWIDIPGENQLLYLPHFENARAGMYRYRLFVNERINQASNTCGVASVPLIIEVHEVPEVPEALSIRACPGEELLLPSLNGYAFQWEGPNGFRSTLQQPLLSNLQVKDQGDYTLTVFNAAGCQATRTIHLTVNEPVLAVVNPVGTVEICEGESIQLKASGGIRYAWSPSIGLSADNIASPLANPTESTLYTVAVMNENCMDTVQIMVKVVKAAKADAGPDLQLLSGQSTLLKAHAEGVNLRYSWSPPDYLDNPHVLQPLATPPKDMVYTLTVQSACHSITDQVFVKVFPEIAIPNSFSPNNDGINDTWDMPFMQAFEQAEVRVFTRSGQVVFHQKGTYVPWDGTYRSKHVPVGAYYYHIFLHESFPLQRGWLFIVR